MSDQAGLVGQLQWSESGLVAIPCAVCGRVDDQTLLATAAVEWRDAPVELARCADCHAIVISAVRPPADFFDEAIWDGYVESTAGLALIADLIAKAGRGPGSSMLDVGCGYGFGLDMGSFLFGWQAVGLDPSTAAARGRVELGLDIRSGDLESAFADGEVFDVIVASEVVEHVGDARAFVTALASRLAADGVLLLSTPDAACVRPDTDPLVLRAAVALGAHVFLVDAAGLERLLRDVGLQAVVTRESAGLQVVAAHSAEALATADLAAVAARADLARYCDARADAADVGSVLQVGMVARHLEYTVNMGDLAAARTAVPRLRRALLHRYGADIDDPDAPIALDACNVLVGVHYFLGILVLNGDGPPERAAEHFAAAVRAARSLYAEHGAYRDSLVPEFEFIAIGNRAIALATAMARPRVVDAALSDVDEAVRRGLGTAEASAAFRARTREIQTTLATTTLRRVARRLRVR